MANKNRNKRTYLIIGAVVVLVVVVAAIATTMTGRAQTAVPEGDVVTAFVGDLSAQAAASGTIQARRTAALTAEMPEMVMAVNVRLGDRVQAGDVLVQLDTGDLELAVANAEQTLRLRRASLDNLLAAPEAADVAAAEAAVAGAQANLDEVLAGPRAQEIAIGEANVRASQASVASAAADLAGARDRVTEAQILSAEAALTSARAQLDDAREENEKNPTAATHQALLEAQQTVADAEAQLDSLRAGPDVDAEQSSVAAASARLEGSEAELNQMQGGPTEAEIAAAELQLAQAEASLVALLEEPSAEEIAAVEAEGRQAELDLEDAQEQLADASIVAPFAGVVTAVRVSAGEVAGGVVVEMAAVAGLEVVLSVDEIDISEIEIGQPAIINLETWPEIDIESEVTKIAPDATVEPGTELVTYDVHLTLGETDLPVRIGMTANADLVTTRREDVLLVPNAAINADRQAGTYSVNLLIDGEVQEVPVTIGLRDDEFTQITGGLNEGDELLVDNGVPVETFGPGPQD